MKAKLVYRRLCEEIRIEWKPKQSEFHIEENCVFTLNRPAGSQSESRISRNKTQKVMGNTHSVTLFHRLNKRKSETLTEKKTDLSVDLLSFPVNSVSKPIEVTIIESKSTVPLIKTDKVSPKLPKIKHNMSISDLVPVKSAPPPSVGQALDMESLLQGLDLLKEEAKRRKEAETMTVVEGLF